MKTHGNTIPVWVQVWSSWVWVWVAKKKPGGNLSHALAMKSLPADFYPMAHKHIDAFFGAVMQVLQDDQIIGPILKELEEVEQVRCLSKVIMKWASGWEG
jgi:hypothetical protein